MSSAPTAIAIAVVQQSDQFLIGQRPPGVALPGYWEFPGGKVEAGEAPEAAAVRECLEETGLHVSVLFAYPEHVQHYAHDRVHLFFFACEPLEQSGPPHPPYRWVPRRDLTQYPFPEGNRALLKILTSEAQGAR